MASGSESDFPPNLPNPDASPEWELNASSEGNYDHLEIWSPEIFSERSDSDTSEIPSAQRTP